MEKEKLKLWLDFGKFFFGTFVIGFVSLVVKSGYENREIAIKESEQIGHYVEIALREDIGSRKRFAEYFKTVSVSDLYCERWTEYFDLVNEEFNKVQREADSVQLELNAMQNAYDSLAAHSEEFHGNEAGEHKIDSVKEIVAEQVMALELTKRSLEQELKVEKSVKAINTEPFIIGLYSVKAKESEQKKIKNYINNKSYFLDSEYDYDNVQSWMSGESTVFYYTRSAKIYASKLAADLKKITGKQFKVRIGAGLGVAKGKEDVTFFIHNIN